MLLSTVLRLLIVAAYTVIPLAGVLAFGWGWREILALYWFENIAVGLAMVVYLLRSRRRDGVGSVGLAALFVVHFGVFTIVHGALVVTVVAVVFGPFSAAPMAGTDAALDGPGILGVFAVAAVLQLALALRGPLPTLGGFALMVSVYPRIIALQFTVFLVAVVIAASGWPPVAAVLLIAIHALVDAAALVVRRRRRASIRLDAHAGQAARPTATDAATPPP
ncbi:MAG: DUF6498-containing protein [Microcella sp.]|uniref:DUF6498-containing protein n=1 Tax=Microcella sp. TaxID=1913979 RepID=UPI003316199D